MQSTALRINQLLENPEEDYDKADVEAIVDSLIDAILDTGKKLDEYRNERLKKYEIFD